MILVNVSRNHKRHKLCTLVSVSLVCHDFVRIAGVPHCELEPLFFCYNLLGC